MDLLIQTLIKSNGMHLHSKQGCSRKVPTYSSETDAHTDGKDMKKTLTSQE